MGILLLIHIFITIFLILIVLLQKNEGGSSLFASGGSSNSMFNTRGMSNMLTKTTWTLAFLFLANCVLMAFLASSDIKEEQNVIESTSIAGEVSDNREEEPIVASDSKDGDLEESEDGEKK